ncbi:MAG: inactive transglutaminase family protein [Porticoccus sp.]|nr:inactive transglutaminase family protein [Porticoccus sp.]
MKISSRLQIGLVAGVLILIGLGLTLYKKIELGFPLLPGQRQAVWTLESKISFKPAKGAVAISLAMPEAQAGWVVLDDHFASSGFDFSIQETEGSRHAQWSRPSLDRTTTLYYKLEAYRPDNYGLSDAPVPKIIIPELTVDRLSAMERVVESLHERSSTPESFTAALLQQLVQGQMGQDAAFLFGSREETKLSVVMDVLAFAGIPSQPVKGVFLEDGRRRQQMDTLLEIHDGKRWHIFDPKTAQPGLPENFFVWQRGAKSVLDVVGGKSSQLEFAIVENTLPIKTVLFMEQQVKDRLLLDFSIYSLPVEQQGVFKGLLLIPVGALVVVLLRVLVGIRTSGTFMPILIALAFIQTTLLTGLIIFLIVVGAGLWIRYYLTYLNLLLVARITAVVIVVILLMAALSIVSYKFGFDQLLTVTFLPTIILAWTIERMSILWEEEGGQEVLIQGGGSLFAAILAYLLMSVDFIEHLTFNFPELMISLLGVVLLLGKYNGYRLVELYRFRDFGRSDQ